MSPAAGTVKVGIPVSLTGQFQVQGRQTLLGLRAWADDVNRTGGLDVGGLRRLVEVLHYDDASAVRSVCEITEHLIVRDRADLLIGPYSSVLTNAAAAIAESHEMVIWNQGGASAAVFQRGYRWAVGILTPAGQYLAALPDALKAAGLPVQTMAVLRASTGTFPREVCAGLEAKAASGGVRTVVSRQFDASNTDFASLMAEIGETRPDLIVAVGRVSNDIKLARQLVARQLAGGTAEFGAVAVVAAGVRQFADELGPVAEGFIGPSQWETGAGYAVDCGPSVDEVTASLRRAGEWAVDYPTAQAYAAGVIVQRCVQEAGGLDQAELRRAAASLDCTTFYGRFKIDPQTGRQISRETLLVQWQEGKKVIIWPPEAAQGTLRVPWKPHAPGETAPV